jgi:hypothetical protein
MKRTARSEKFGDPNAIEHGSPAVAKPAGTTLGSV